MAGRENQFTGRASASMAKTSDHAGPLLGQIPALHIAATTRWTTRALKATLPCCFQGSRSHGLFRGRAGCDCGPLGSRRAGSVAVLLPRSPAVCRRVGHPTVPPVDLGIQICGIRQHESPDHTVFSLGVGRRTTTRWPAFQCASPRLSGAGLSPPSRAMPERRTPLSAPDLAAFGWTVECINNQNRSDFFVPLSSTASDRNLVSARPASAVEHDRLPFTTPRSFRIGAGRQNVTNL
jgi:hypothetical protein